MLSCKTQDQVSEVADSAPSDPTCARPHTAFVFVLYVCRGYNMLRATGVLAHTSVNPEHFVWAFATTAERKSQLCLRQTH